MTVPLEVADAVSVGEPGPAESAQRHEIQEIVRRAVERLPPNEREATRLFFLEALSIKEISERLGVSVQAIKNRLHTARARLRQRLMGIIKKTVKMQSRAGDKQIQRGAATEAIQQFNRQIGKLLRFPSEQQQRRAGELVFSRGRLLRYVGKLDEAIDSFQKAMAIPALSGDLLFRARMQAEIGLCLVHASDYRQARRHLRTARTLVGRIKPPPPLECCILNYLGLCAWGEGKFQEARKYYESVLGADCGNEEVVGEAGNNLALLEWKAGRLEESLAMFQDCLKRWQGLGHRHAVAATLINIGILEENLGQITLARRHYREALTMTQAGGFVPLQAAALGNLANLALVEEKWGEAARFAERSRTLARNINDRHSQAIALENLALAQIGQGRIQKALDTIEEARRLARAIGDAERLFSLELVAIEAALADESEENLAERFRAARRVLDGRGYRAERPRLLRLQAHAALSAGQPSEARRLAAAALRECARQHNRSEEIRVQALARRLPAKPKSQAEREQ